MGIGIEGSSAILYMGILLFMGIAGLIASKLFGLSLNVIRKLLLNSIIAGGIMFAFNFILSPYNIHLPMTIPSVITVSLLGLPGLCMVFVFSLFI